VDSNHRLTIPADWRPGEAGALYVGLDSTKKFVIAMSPAELAKTVALIEAMKDVSEATQRLWIREIASGSQLCGVDKQGRMVLPTEFCEAAGLQGEVVVLGMIGEFQVWNAQLWDEQKKVAAPEIAELSRRLGR